METIHANVLIHVFVNLRVTYASHVFIRLLLISSVFGSKIILSNLANYVQYYQSPLHHSNPLPATEITFLKILRLIKPWLARKCSCGKLGFNGTEVDANTHTSNIKNGISFCTKYNTYGSLRIKYKYINFHKDEPHIFWTL